MKRSGNGDQAAAAQAEKQHGAINCKQAREAGLTAEQVEWRRHTGRWRRTASRQVYTIAGFRETKQQRAMVAVLAGPPGTVASHLTVAALLDMVPAPEIPHVTVPPAANGRYAGAVVHRSRLEPVDTCRISGIPCTAPARMLVDCAAMVSHEVLCELVDQTLFRFADARWVREAMRRASRAPGRKGERSLDDALSVWTPGPKPGSPAEMRLVRHLRRLGFPAPERQWKARDPKGRVVAKIDVAWPLWKVGLEYDGEAFHGPRRWTADDDRQDLLEVLGWQIGRVTKHDLGPGSMLETWLTPRVPRYSAA
ncbi:MAG: hypothetical protein ACRDZ3_18790 [Acidimicrobiia bacterium]